MVLATERLKNGTADGNEAPRSSVSWPAIFAGGVVTSAMAFILLTLGTGLGMTMVSPYSGSSVSLTTFAVAAGVWLIIVQWLSAALGAYVAGRLRTRWVAAHDKEVFFRDTAHGLLSWAVAVAIGAAIFGVTSLGATKASTETPAPADYYVDGLFRGASDLAAANGAKQEAKHILASSASNGKVSDQDKAYLNSLVASRTGLSEPDAGKRVDAVLTRAQADAETARKVAVRASLYLFFSMLIGAFIACVAGAIGGRQRDDAEASWVESAR